MTIICHTLFGIEKEIPIQELVFRPSAYGIIQHRNRLLLLKMHNTGAYCLPGGGIELGEKIEEGLRREIREEAGIEVEVKQLVHFREDFFYYDPTGNAFHGLMFFYLCTPLTYDLLSDNEVQDEEAEMPRWVEIDALKPDDFFNDGTNIMDALTKY